MYVNAELLLLSNVKLIMHILSIHGLSEFVFILTEGKKVIIRTVSTTFIFVFFCLLAVQNILDDFYIVIQMLS